MDCLNRGHLLCIELTACSIAIVRRKGGQIRCLRLGEKGGGHEQDRMILAMQGFRIICAAALLSSVPTLAAAKTVEVKMLNKGAGGTMVFEPAYVDAAVGDTVHFKLVDKGHNAAPIAGMLPNGVKAADGAFNSDYDLKLTKAGLYGIKCTPHIGLGMVALIKAGPGPAPNAVGASAAAHALPPMAQKRMLPLLAAAK